VVMSNMPPWRFSISARPPRASRTIQSCSTLSDDFASLAAGAALGMVPVVYGEAAADAAAIAVFFSSRSSASAMRASFAAGSA
jgi:hypothetical protein